MKKIIIKTALALLGTTAFAQNPSTPAALPTTEIFNEFTASTNFTTTVGWIFNENASGTPQYVYTSGGVSGSAMGKLDEANDNIVFYASSQMGMVTYYLKGQNLGCIWNGVFNVDESVNGTTWTNLASYTNATPNFTTLTQYTVNPAPASRYLRWIFVTKTATSPCGSQSSSGNNVAIDNISIAAGVPADADINVKYNSNTILTGGTTPYFGTTGVGTPTNVAFTIENIGQTALNISNVTFTGTNAADFSVVSPGTSFSVAGQANQSLVIQYNPAVAGNSVADMIITSDDIDEPSYIIHLRGTSSALAAEPAQASNVTFSGLKSYRAVYSFQPSPGGADGYLVLVSKTPITTNPVDGTTYNRGATIGLAKVAYVGTSTVNIVPTVWANTQYYVAVFAFNGGGTYINYNTTLPVTNSFTSSGSMLTTYHTNYYGSVSTSNATFVTDLHNAINGHTQLNYQSPLPNYTSTMIDLFEARDTATASGLSRKFVECRYSKDRAVYSGVWDWTANDFSREHTYCEQWMPSNPTNSTIATYPFQYSNDPAYTSSIEYSDYHNLFPTVQTGVNDLRSNYPLGDVVTVSTPHNACKLGTDVAGHTVFEPRSDQKGDAARAIMYMAVAYNSVNGNNWGLRDPISASGSHAIPYGQDQDLLKKWHFQDPPDAYEIARHDLVDSLQHNRNPFIDSASYACHIDFKTMSYIAAPSYSNGICYTAVGIKENVATQFEYIVAPNPTTGEFYLMIDAKVAEKFNLDITDVAGRNVYNRTVDVNNGFNTVTVNDLKLQSGVYFVNLHYKNEKITRKLIIQ